MLNALDRVGYTISGISVVDRSSMLIESNYSTGHQLTFNGFKH